MRKGQDFRIVVAEDEAPQRRVLLRQLARLWPAAEIVAECVDGTQATAAIDEHRPNVVFLDIRMPGANGVAVAKSASKIAHIVFTTAFDQYAVDAFETGAVDYLLKPIQTERLARALERIERREKNETPQDIGDVLERLENQLRPDREQLRWITASVGDTIKMIDIEDVLFFQAQDKYVRVVTIGGEAIIRQTLKATLDRLDPDAFWQIHRGTVVAVAAIDKLKKNDLGKWELTIKGQPERLSVSPTFQGQFRGM